MPKKRTQKSTVTLNYDQAVKFCVACLRADRTPYLEGPPGIGKSTTAHDIVKIMKLDGYVVITPTMHNALDLRGFGYTADLFDKNGKNIGKETRFAQSTVLPSEGKYLIFVDELPDCPIHEQSGFYQLLLEGKIGEYSMPAGSYVMGAGNRPEDRAAANTLSSAIRGRIATCRMMPTMESVTKHAIKSGWNPMTIGFMKTFPECIDGFDPTDIAGGCTPRDLDAISRLENAEWPVSNTSPIGLALCEGNLGSKMGVKYHSYRRITIPDPKLAIKSPTKAKIDYPKDVMFAYLAAIAQHCTIENVPKVAKYANRLDEMFKQGLMFDCLSTCDGLIDTKTGIEWYEQTEQHF